MFLLFLGNQSAQAGELAEKLANFPNWEKIKVVKPAVGDLQYPDWMAGNWQVSSTLVDLAAPLAPDIVTPGFAGNRQYLNQPIDFRVRFVETQAENPELKLLPHTVSQEKIIVSDRAFNGLNLAKAYLGDRAVIAVKVDPQTPNRQITLLRGEKQLVSIVSSRATETTADDTFITTEVFQQLFKGSNTPYFNSVESTTAYHQLSTEQTKIVADQVTAVYLSPQDSNYFQAGNKPVALYRYQLEFTKINSGGDV